MSVCVIHVCICLSACLFIIVCLVILVSRARIFPTPNYPYLCIICMSGPVVSALTNKFGCRPVTVAGSVIAGVAFLISIMAPTVDVLIVTYGVMGGK